MTVVAALEAWLSVAATVVAPPFSGMDPAAAVSVTVGAASSSVIVRRAPVTAPTPCGFDAAPGTVTTRSGASVVLPTPVTVTVSALFDVLPAGIRIVASEPTVTAPATAETVIVVARLEAWLRVAEIVVEPPFSRIRASAAASLTAGASSSSRIVPVAVAIPTAAPADALLSVTTTVSSGSSVVSPVTDTVIVPLPTPAAMVSVPAASAA